MPLKRSTNEVVDSVDPIAYEVRGVRRWAVDISFSHEGQPVRLQRRGFISRGAALTFAETEVALIRAGLKPAKVPQALKARDKTTVAEAFERLYTWWLENKRMKASTLHIVRSGVGKHILPVLGSVPWSALSQAQVDGLITAAKDMHSPRHLLTLRSALRDSKRAGLTPPAVELDPIRTEKREKTDYLTIDQLEKLCKHTTPFWAACFRLLFHTGLRAGELCALETGDLDLRYQNEVLTVRRTIYNAKGEPLIQTPKSGRQRTIPLNVEAVRALMEITKIRFPGRGMFPPADAPLEHRLIVANRSGKYLLPGTLRNAIHDACRRAKMDYISPHTLRHSFASALVNAGVDIFSVARLLGHSSVEMTMRYSHRDKNGERADVTKLDRLANSHRRNNSKNKS